MFSSLLGYETIGKESGKCRQFSVIYTYSTGTDLHYSNSQWCKSVLQLLVTIIHPDTSNSWF